jgi:hypothetical protein
VDGIKRLERVFKLKNFIEAIAFTNKIGICPRCERPVLPSVAIEAFWYAGQVDSQGGGGGDLLSRKLFVERHVCHAEDYPSFIVDGQIGLWDNLQILMR